MVEVLKCVYSMILIDLSGINGWCVAASLPLLFIDGAKLHGLNYWYALFPGAAGCLLLSVLVSLSFLSCLSHLDMQKMLD